MFNTVKWTETFCCCNYFTMLSFTRYIRLVYCNDNNDLNMWKKLTALIVVLNILMALYWLVLGDSSVKKKHECTECGHQFRTKALLKRHNLTHSGERPFTCATCDKRFSRQDHLRRHMVTHMNAFTPTFPDFQYWVFIIEVCRYCPMSRPKG